MESCGGLFLLKCCEDTPFVVKMCDYRFGCLSAVSDKVVIEFFNVCGVNAFTNNLVKNESTDGFLLPVLLALKVAIGHDLCTVGESRVVCKGSGHWA